MASNQMIVAALGRPFTLGMLYDARSDKLLKGRTLWESGCLQRMTHRRLQPYSNFTITGSDSAEEKASLLDVEASLRASVLCGFVEAEGSAKYLQSRQQFKNQSRVTLQYKATTHFEQLSLTSDVCEKVQNTEMIEKGLATHVVTGIEYGANAFFVFDSQQVETSEIHEFKLKIKVIIHLFFWSVHVDYDRDLTEEQKSLVKELTVTFHSDFLLPSIPATLQEAVQTYRDITKLLGTNDENAVPVRVWMMPLKYLNTNAVQMVRGISVGLVIEAENTVDDLSNIQMRCNDSLTDSTVGKFPTLHHQLSTFHRYCHYYTVELKRQMKENCPLIREGKKDESALSSIFNRENTPFNQDQLSKWLDDREKEINVIQSCLNIMEGVPVLSTQAEVDRFVLSPENATCCGYIFTSLTNTDPFLEEMGQYLDALKMGEGYEQLSKGQEVPWYYSDEIVTKMRELAHDVDKAKNSTNTFIAAIYKNKNSGAAGVKYRDGTNQDFQT